MAHMPGLAPGSGYVGPHDRPVVCRPCGGALVWSSAYVAHIQDHEELVVEDVVKPYENPLDVTYV